MQDDRRGPRPFQEFMSSFLRPRATARAAGQAIVVATVMVVVISGTAMRVFDRKEYGGIGKGLWWAIQTVTTVGYGDVTPAKPIGRLIAAVVMLWGIAFLTILVAVVTSTFVAKRVEEEERSLAAEEDVEQLAILARLDELAQRLERIESTVSDIASR
jgi:voltage-gated potassium channel Kch